MSDHRCILKIEFSIYGKKFEWDTSINWDNHTGDGGIDSRIVNWFADCYAEARADWDHESMLEDEALERVKLESRERLELARLKAKYDTDNQTLRRIQEANPILPQKHPPEPPDAGASTDDFDRTKDTLGPNWTDTYDGAGAGAWGRMGATSEGGVTWQNPSPAGDFTTSGIVCRECGHKVVLKAGDIVRSGDPRLCEHLGGPGPISGDRGFGFGMKAGESSPGDITRFTIDEPKCTCAPGTARTSCPVHGLSTVDEPDSHGYWEKGDY